MSDDPRTNPACIRCGTTDATVRISDGRCFDVYGCTARRQHGKLCPMINGRPELGCACTPLASAPPTPSVKDGGDEHRAIAHKWFVDRAMTLEGDRKNEDSIVDLLDARFLAGWNVGRLVEQERMGQGQDAERGRLEERTAVLSMIDRRIDILNKAIRERKTVLPLDRLEQSAADLGELADAIEARGKEGGLDGDERRADLGRRAIGGDQEAAQEEHATEATKSVAEGSVERAGGSAKVVQPVNRTANPSPGCQDCDSDESRAVDVMAHDDDLNVEELVRQFREVRSDERRRMADVKDAEVVAFDLDALTVTFRYASEAEVRLAARQVKSWPDGRA